MKVSFSTVALMAIATFTESVSASCGHGTSLLRRQVNISKREASGEAKKTVEVAKFGYFNEQGPTGWAALAVENAGCSTSTRQSPIDVTNTTTQEVAPGTLKMNFPTVASAEFENIGTTLEVVMEGKNASTTVNGKVFALKQFHIHTPSEHTVNGQYFPLEMHMVHEASDGSIAVIAAHFQLSETGETTSLLTEATTNIAKIATPGTITETGAIDFAPFVAAINAQTLSTYTGSLTTPPCAEGLQFFVTTKQLPINVATFNTIKSVVGFNARFVQATPGTENLLSAASKQIMKQAPIGVAPPAASTSASSTTATPAATSSTPAEKVEAIQPSHPVTPMPSMPAMPAAPAVPAPAHPPAAAPVAHQPGNAQVIGGGAGGTLTPELAKLIQDATGIIIPMSKKVRRGRRAFKA